MRHTSAVVEAVFPAAALRRVDGLVDGQDHVGDRNAIGRMGEVVAAARPPHAFNETMAPEVQTVFMPASPDVRPITATLVRQIASMHGDVSSFVPAEVATRLKAKFMGKPGR